MTENIVEKLKRKYEKEIFVDDEVNDEVDVISTGSLSLDVSTGIGGIPRGRFTVLWGSESSGKTTTALEVARNAIEQGLSVAYIDTEQTLDYNYARAIIGEFDTSKLLIVHPEEAEEALLLAESIIHGDDEIGLAPGLFGMVVIDSIAALSPKKERDKELTDKNIALVANLMTPFIRRNASAVRKQNIAVILINQVRANIMGYSNYELTGGWALKHYSSMEIFLGKGQKIKEGDNIVGILVNFTIKKNKLAPPFRSYTYPIIFTEEDNSTGKKGIDLLRDAIDFGSTMGIIKKRGAWYSVADDNGELINMGQGVKNAAEFMKENPWVLDKIKEVCYNTISKYKGDQDK